MTSWRRYLGANIGHDAVLWSSHFEIRYNPHGDMLLFLTDYEVRKICDNNLNIPKPKTSGHLWIKVPEAMEYQCLSLMQTARKISIKGTIRMYQYKDSDRKNVTLRMKNICKLKDKKEKGCILESLQTA